MIKQIQSIKYFFSRVLDSISNIIRWFPIIWKDRDWDYYYLLAIMQFKISNMRKLHEKNKRFISSPKVIKQLRTCEELLKRLQNKSEYCSYEYKEHNNKWGELTLKFGKITERNTRECLLERSKVLTEKDKEQEIKEYKRIMEKENYMYEQDVDLLLKIIKKYHRKWWD